MKKISLKVIVAFVLLAGFIAGPVSAQNKTNLSIGADVVSSFVWRGSLFPGFTGVNIQPSAVLSKGGLFGGVWGSGTLNGSAKQADLFIGYGAGGFTAKVTDYWFGGQYFEYGKNDTGHLFEGTLSYQFGASFPLSVAWNTFFHGSGDLKSNGDKRYSTYIELGYPATIHDVNLNFALGVSPWESSLYHTDRNGNQSDGFIVSNISVKASKKIAITPTYSLPLFTQLVVNPTREDVNFVVGLSL